MKKILFGLPIYSFRIDPKSFDKTKIIKDIEENYKISNKRNTWDNKSNLHHLYNDSVNKKFKQINFDKLNEVYKDVFTKFCNSFLNLKKDFKITFSVKNYTAVKKDQYMASHQHLVDCDFSAVHYIQFPKEGAPITFINQQDFARYLLFLRPDYCDLSDNKDLSNSYLYQNYKYIPVEDEIIIFPSVFLHEIEKQKPINKARISIVVNLTIEKDK